MAKQLPKQVLETVVWIKSNTLVVIYSAIIVSVPIGAFFAANWFGTGVQTEAEKKSKAYSSLTTAINAKVNLPLPGGAEVPLDGLPTESTVAEFRAILTGAEADAESVFNAALARNQGTAGNPAHKPVVGAEIFPAYPRSTFAQIDGVRGKYVKALNAAYIQLLASVDAGSPPLDSAVKSTISAAEERFVRGEKRLDSREKLSPEDKVILEKQLTTARLQACNEIAKVISFYADMSAFSVPSEEDPAITGLFKDLKDADNQDKMLFDLQWRYWITADILNAFAAANGKSGSVINDPVKRLVQLTVLPMEMSVAVSSAGEATAMNGEVGSEGTEQAAPIDPSLPPPEVVDPTVVIASAGAELGKPVVDNHLDAARDYSKRFTGRVSNAVYDVRLAEVTFIAETSKLPIIFDKLAAQNFMTITNVRIAQVDLYSAARAGFLFGTQPVSEVKATIETVWLRAWTAEFMPSAVRTALGIQSTIAPSNSTPEVPPGL